MIASANGVISTTNDDVMHMSYQDARGDWVNCTTPYHLHKRPDGSWMTCADAAKFANHNMMGARTLKHEKKQETGPQIGLNVPVNLPR